jgi:putative transcriptional regulator
MTPAEIKALRVSLGLSQQRFAVRYRLPVATLQSWEQGRRTPELGSMLLLLIIRENPLVVAALIAKIPNPP